MGKDTREVAVSSDKTSTLNVNSSRQIPSHKVSRHIPGKEEFAIPSISAALKGDSAVKDKDRTPGFETDFSSRKVEANPFTQDQLNTIWGIFVEDVDAPQLKSALSSRLPLLKENWEIVYELDNDLQNQRITLELKPQLLGFLRKQFRNENIQIEFTISENKDSKPDIPYTDVEKWQNLAEKYPSLISLKNKFGLDFQ